MVMAQSLEFTVPSWCCIFGLDKCVIIRIDHYGIQSLLTAMEIVCLPPIHSFPPSATTNLFSISVTTPFPGCHRVGISQWVAFSI